MTTVTPAERLRAMEEVAAGIPRGAEWIFRSQDEGPSRRVRIVGEHRTPTTIQMEIEHLEGPRSGQRATVGLRRLKGPWAGVEEFDARERRRGEIERSHRASHRPDYSAALVVLAAVVPETVMTARAFPGSRMTVHDQEALAALCGAPFSELVREEESLTTEDGVVVSADAAVRIAKAACTANPGLLTTELLKRERRLLLVPYHREVRAAAEEDGAVAVLHDWCGTQPSEIRLRIVALENELAWQRSLVREATDLLRACGVVALADNLASLSGQGPPERRGLEYSYGYGNGLYAGGDVYVPEEPFPW